MIRYSDILKQKKIPIFTPSGKEYYKDKTILVTGGGGSVGRELVRHLVSLSPKNVIIFDIYENNAFELCNELCCEYTHTDIRIEIGSVCDTRRLCAVFSKYKPDIVFHAAAHKHVSLMEENCAEAVKNNCIGTVNTAELAEKYHAEKFVLVSTDKAVRPTGVMGASKRICEMLVLPRKSVVTKFCAVRFGNVFASHASVVPIFEKQILSGKDVTITDKRMTRYFISLDDAAQLLEEAEQRKLEAEEREKKRIKEERERIRREKQLAIERAQREEEERKEQERQAILAEEQRKLEEARKAQDEKDTAGVKIYLDEVTVFLDALAQRLAMREEEARRIQREQEQREQERQRRLAARMAAQ